jgi:hypothetical protein
VAGVGMACIFAGVEAALILTLTVRFGLGTPLSPHPTETGAKMLTLRLKPIYNNGNEAPILVIGIVAAVLLAIGLLPPYREIWKRHGRVIGFNWVFLSMDWCGAFFSLMALGKLTASLSIINVVLTLWVTVAQNTFDVTGGVLYIIW